MNSGAKLKRDFGHLVLDVVEKYECEFFDEVAADQDFDLQRDVPNKDNFERLCPRKTCSAAKSEVREFRWLSQENEDEEAGFFDINGR